MLKITSRENQRLKNARRVRDGRSKDLVFIEGRRLAEEALRSETEITEVFLAEEFAAGAEDNDFIDRLVARARSVFEVSEKLFSSIADTKTSQGIILIGERPDTSKAALEAVFDPRIRDFPLAILLSEVNNPSNLGAILRTAEAVNAAGVIISRNSADAFSPKALRASMGASLRLPIWDDADFDEALSWVRKRGLVPTAADVSAAKSYLEIDWKRPRLLVFGSEAHGLSGDELKKIDETLLIPMENEVESLNLAVSCGIILFEAKRRNSF